jgi:hypothetical protein
MCLVLTMTQAFAISGGPFGGNVNVVGVYAGVLRHPSEPPPVPPPAGCDSPAPGCSLNSLGVFSIAVPSSGLATGTFVMFSQGRVFTGTISGVADPGKAKLIGVLNATFNFTVTDNSTIPPTVTNVTASANGNLKTTIRNVLSESALGVTATRLGGTATLDIDQGMVSKTNFEPCITCFMVLRVSGFKQTNTAPGTT